MDRSMTEPGQNVSYMNENYFTVYVNHNKGLMLRTFHSISRNFIRDN